jgi:hypothetical protein
MTRGCQLKHTLAAPLRTWSWARLAAVALLLGALIGGAPAAVAQHSAIVFDLKIEKGRVAPNMRRIRVKQGDTVRLRFTSDRPITLHLHGYDIETKIEPGRIAEMSFAARTAGRFPVEEHGTGARGAHSHGEAPLVQIEVYPR